MKERYETYLSSPSEGVPSKFILVAFGEGRGKFSVRRIPNSEIGGWSYQVEAIDRVRNLKREQLLSAIPSALQQVFERGALNVSYVEGDAVLEFPPEFSERLSALQYQELSDLALNGLFPLVRDFAIPLLVPDEMGDGNVNPGQLCILVALLICLLTWSYGGKIFPLEWMSLTIYCFIAVLLALLLRPALFRKLFAKGKILSLSLITATSILLMLLIGVGTRFLSDESGIEQEGILESIPRDAKLNALRIRLASEPESAYLISKEFLEQPVQRLPHAARLSIQKGPFGVRYVRKLTLIQ